MREETDLQSWFWLLLCQKTTGDLAGFGKNYTLAINVAPTDQNDKYARGFIEFLAGHLEKAKEFYYRSDPSRPWYDVILRDIGI